MSSMRNAVQRRNHKERAQPVEREKWGILEKHKDYSLRAKDYNEKKKRLKILRQKAAERNPDEFHFAMMSSKTDSKGLKIADRGNKSLSVDTVKLLKTQDVEYLRTMAQKTRKAREKLEQQVILQKDGKESVVKFSNGGYDSGNQHLVFVESTKEQKNFDLRRRTSATQTTEKLELDSDEEADRVTKSSTSTSKNTILAQAEVLKAQMKLRKQRRKHQDTHKSQLDALKKRERDLMAAEHELELQRAKMSGSIGGVTKAGVKWKVRERKR